VRLLPVGQQHQDADAALWPQAFVSAANLGAAKKVGFQLLAARPGVRRLSWMKKKQTLLVQLPLLPRRESQVDKFGVIVRTAAGSSTLYTISKCK
jgi:hypothetical protein